MLLSRPQVPCKLAGERGIGPASPLRAKAAASTPPVWLPRAGGGGGPSPGGGGVLCAAQCQRGTPGPGLCCPQGLQRCVQEEVPGSVHSRWGRSTPMLFTQSPATAAGPRPPWGGEGRDLAAAWGVLLPPSSTGPAPARGGGLVGLCCVLVSVLGAGLCGRQLLPRSSPACSPAHSWQMELQGPGPVRSGSWTLCRFSPGQPCPALTPLRETPLPHS